MKTKWHFYIFWSVLSLDLLHSYAVDTYDSPFTGRKKPFKLGSPKLPRTGHRKSSQRLPASTSSLPQLSSHGPHAPPAPVTPRSMRPGEPWEKIQSDFAPLPDVSVTCSTSDLVVRVKPALYGLGADADELKLGNTCKSNGVLRPYGDLLFTYPLTACDAVRQSSRDYLVYKFVLHYEPSAKRFPSRAQRIDVDIECRYQRSHHVSQLTVQPTWTTTIVRKKLKGRPNDFQIELMDDSWSRPAKTRVYQLGKTVNFQVSAPHVPTGGKVYISSCYATPSSSPQSSLKYTVIDSFGCMVDSKRDPGGSQFISRTDKTLRFSLRAFQFTSDPDTEVSVHCRLFVTSEGPGPAYKSCTYRGNRWTALTGGDSICECCDSQCVIPMPRRAMKEGFASSGSLLVSDEPYTAEDGFLPISPSSTSTRREDKASVNQYTDEMHSPETLWGIADVIMFDDDEGEEEEEDGEEQQLEEESVVTLGGREPDLEYIIFREGILVEEKNALEVMNSDQFEEHGSGYAGQEDFSEERFEGREEETSDVEQAINLNKDVSERKLPSDTSLQRESQLLVSSDGEEENSNYTGRDNRMITAEVEWKNDEDSVDDREMTWYFTWR